jgi:hypothetical protein
MVATAPDWQGSTVLSAEAFAAHCATGDVLERKQGEVAVMVHRDAAGRAVVTKVWRRQRSWLVSLVRPYHRQFRRALQELPARGVRVPRYRAHGRVRGSDVRFVMYEWLEGEVLRARLREVDLGRLAAMVADLHARGVYFRGLHLGNVVQDTDGQLGLIDVQDVRLRRRPLSARMRARNLGILCAHPWDRAFLSPKRCSELVLAYCRAAGLGVADTARMRARVHAQIRRRGLRRAARRKRRGLDPLPE